MAMEREKQKMISVVRCMDCGTLKGEEQSPQCYSYGWCTATYRTDLNGHPHDWNHKDLISPYEKAKTTFLQTEAMALNCPNLPDNNIWCVQARLARWQNRNFNSVSLKDSALGMAEEVGEAALGLLGLAASMGKVTHAVLKSSQGIRGMGDEETFRAAVADGIADAMIYATQLCTMLRIDFGTLYTETAEEVMKREWKK